MSDSREMTRIANDSIALVVTSRLSDGPNVGRNIWGNKSRNLPIAERRSWLSRFQSHAQMHATDLAECVRVLKPGGLMVINIGDATRKIGDDR